MTKKKVDWMNCTIVSHTNYNPQIIRKAFDPENNVVAIMNRKWKKKNR